MTEDQIIKAVTANRLTDGVPIYLTPSGAWSTDISEAACASDAAALLVQAETMTEAAVGPYVIDVARVNDHVRPVGLREQIRAYGPTA